jgi:hypothetical protein
MQANTILIDKIAAVVNEEIITLTDIDKAIQFYPLTRKKGESEEAFYVTVLEDLINYKAIYLEYKDEFKLTEEDFEEVQAPIIMKFRSLNKLMDRLEKFDMKWSDFEDFIEEKVVYEKVLKEKFLDEIKIEFKEIEIFYNKEYVPQQMKLNLIPKSLIEMTPRIEKQLKKSRIRKMTSSWLKGIKSSYKIENKMAQEAK